jgi:sulfoxide reductase heme-binding subunit YedZ
MLARLKIAVWIACLSPLAWTFWLAAQSQLGPDPGKALTDGFGLWALRLLLIVLLLRPLRDWTGKPQFVQVRRLVSLFAWFYATLHFAAGLFYVIGWSWADLLKAFDERRYITLGLLAWILMLPLGLTSNRVAQRRLGLQWRKLHRLVYPLAILACLHFVWLVREDYRQPAIYSGLLFILLLWRLPVVRSRVLRSNAPAEVTVRSEKQSN